MKKAFLLFGLLLIATAFMIDVRAQVSSSCYGMQVSGDRSFPQGGASQFISPSPSSGCTGGISYTESLSWASVSGYTITVSPTSTARSGSIFILVNGTTVSQFTITQAGPAAPSTPSTPTITSNNCGQVRLSRGSPPSGVTWYWQGTNSNGTSTANSSSTYTVSATGRYYLRARSSSGVWSTSSSSRNVTSITQFSPGSISGAQTICSGGNPSTIGNSTSASGGTSYAYQWQIATSENGSYSNISGATSTSYNPPVLTSTRWYRRRVISCSSQTKYSNKVRILVNPTPSTASGSNRERCGPGALTLTASPGSNGNTIRWYSASSGGTLLRTGTSYTTPSLSSSRTYYAESYNSSTGCRASSRRAITATILSTVGNATGQNAARCESGTLTLTASPGSNGNTIRWYSSSTGGSSLATGTTYTTPSLTSTTTYYAESYNSTTGCFASARTPIVAEILPVLAVATGSGSSRCGTGSVTLSASPGTNGNTIRWFATASGGSVLATGTNFTTPGISASTTYYAETYNTTTTCSAVSRTAVLAEVNTPENWYLDADGDGYAVSVTANCGSPGAGYTNTVLPVDDCNDDPAADGQLYNPDTIWYADENEDGFADAGAETRQQCERPSGNWTLNSELAPCGVSAIEKQALLDLYNATDGGNWSNTLASNQPWNTNIPVCNWYGVTVENQRVVGLDLNANISSANGTIPPSIGDLVHLINLDLQRNNLTGNLPSEIGSLGNLENLNLSYNNLIGVLPDEIGSLTNLKTIDIIYNGFSGNIPSTIGLLSDLEVLRLGQNAFTGTIPVEVRQLSNLIQLSAYSNQLSGPIPPELSELNNLRFLTLSGNQLSGSIPPQLSLLTNLNTFDLTDNQLTGNIPPELGSLSNVTQFQIGSNLLTGTIPPELGQLSNAFTVFLDDNQLTGSIPDTFNQLTNLSFLFVHNNQLSGPIPDQLSNLSDFSRFITSSNNYVFTDLEPTFAGLLGKLGAAEYRLSPQSKTDLEEALSVPENESITLTSSALTSPNNNYQWFKDGVAIPGATSKDYVISDATPSDAGVYYLEATNSIVTGLTLTRNNITLTIDPPLDTCGVSDTVRQALIDFFNATGGTTWVNSTNWNTEIPVCDWFGVTVVDGELVSLQLPNNNVIGTLPESIGNLIDLNLLDLSNNGIQGGLPPSLGSLLDLDVLLLPNNGLTGELPPALGSLSNLTRMDLSNNNLESQIPISFCNLTNVTDLDLSDNGLFGDIPSQFELMASLVRLDLSNNQLTGRLPFELTRLNNLREVAVENNQLSGAIPFTSGNSALILFTFQNNKFIFSNFESQHDYYSNTLATYNYTPQLKTDTEQSLSVTLGNDVTLSTELSSSNNSYVWYKVGSPDAIIPDAVGNELLIEDATAEDAGTYYFLATNSTVQGLELTRNSVTLNVITTCDVNQSERQALITLYNATGGANWNNTAGDNQRWGVTNTNSLVCDWYGVTVVNNSVTEIVLPNNNIVGTLPDVFAAFPSLERVDFSGNDLNGDISGLFTGILSLDQLALENNTYTFANLESDFASLLGQLGANFTFSPQANVDEAEERTAEAGETITLSSSVLNSGNNQYQWFKDGLPLDGETNKDLVLSNVTTSDNGGYHFSATNSIVTGLDLEREMIMLEVNTGNDACGVSDLERNALIALYNALDGPNWNDSTNWNTSAPVCDWYGVVTDVDANVVGLALGNNGLRGEIPNSVLQLGSLTSVDLQQNNIIGQIPDNIGALVNLQYLLLNDNILVGTIPLSIGDLSALIEFDIANNRVAGALPDNIGGMQQLRYFDANDNKLVQGIPTSLYSIPGLVRFNVSNNQMNGSVSSAIGNLSQLEEFWLANNAFGGTLPETISTIPTLRSVRLNNNAFRGDIPLLIPDFNMANTEVAIEYNNFVFSDFEAEYPAYLNGLDIFTYDPQALVDRQETIRVLENDDVTLGTEDLSSPNNTYIWYKDGVEIPGETGSSLTITDFDPVADTGEYWFVASNTVIDVLQLTRRRINLLERVLLPLDALSLVATCSDNPANLRNWEINNPNAQNVPINWQVVGTSQSGTLMAAPGITRFTTNTEVGDNTVQITWQDTDGTDQTAETISTTETCTPTTECTDLLSGIVDGSFETAVGASTQGRNATFEVSGWSVAQGDPDTFATPFVNNGDPYLFNSFMASPDGGNCFGALRVGNTAEAITTTINGLVPGTTYVVQFYQANATNLLDTRIADQAFGSWQVQASGEQLESNPMAASTRNVRWQRALLEFTASTSSTTLRFAPQATANNSSNSYPVYMLLDGVRMYEKPTDPFTTVCYGIETQVFCNNAEDNPPTVSDLAAPQGSSVLWYADPVGGIPYGSSDRLYDLEPILWADNGSGSRTAVEVLFDLGAPEALEYQTFDLNENPTLANVAVIGNNITWHSSFFDTVELPLNTPLVDEGVYYAAQDGNFCRIPILINIGIPILNGNGFQEFCSSTAPMISDLEMQPTNPAYTVVWYDAPEGGSPYANNDPLVNGTTYYAVQTNGSDLGENRLPVRVSVIDEEANAQIYEWDVRFPNGSTVADVTTYYRLDESTVWYNQAFGGTPYFETTNLSAGNTYYARIDEGLCSGLRVLAITVDLDDITEPDLVTCIKFVPQPGREYVVSGWVREEALTAQPAGTIEFNLDDAAKDAVVALFNGLTNTIVGEALEIPGQFVVKDLFPDLDMSAVLPYLKDFTGNNVTVYDFRFIEENIDGLKRRVGYSFALDPSTANRMEYRTPQVVLSFGSIFGVPLDFGLGYNYPILNYENLEIEHHSVSVLSGDRLRVNSSFILDLPEDSVLKGTYANYDTDGTVNSGIEGTTEIFDYIENPDYSVINYEHTSIQLEYKDVDGNPISLTENERVLEPKGAVIDGWQRISNVFRIPAEAAYMRMNLITDLDGTNAYFDDVRMHPIDSNVKSFVYDPITQRLQAELDENNYATYYEYDTEGGLVRVKKETERGIYTIQETRSGNSKLNGSR